MFQIFRMNKYRITIKQIFNDEVSLEDIREIFFDLEINNVSDFKEKKASGDLPIPSFDNLNALCKEKKGQSFEVFFFGNSEHNLKIEKKLIDHELIDRIKKWCIDNNIQTLTEYRFTKRPEDFPTFKATVNNYGENYFYEIIGLQKHKPNFSTKLFTTNFINELREWCIENKISSKNEYLRKKPNNFPSLERIRQLTGKDDYFKEVLKIDFKR